MSKPTTYFVLLAAVVSLAFSSFARAEEFTFRVLRPDGTPIEKIGIQVEAASIRYKLGPDPSRANWYTNAEGIVTVDIPAPADPNEQLIVTLTPFAPYPQVPQNIRRECSRIFLDVSAKYAISRHYIFTPQDASGGQIAEIRLPESVQARVAPISTEFTAARVHRVNGNTFPTIPKQIDNKSDMVVPIPLGERSVLYVLSGPHIVRIVITPDKAVMDIDLGEIDLDMPENLGHVRVEAPRVRGVSMPGLTFVSQDAQHIFSYVYAHPIPSEDNPSPSSRDYRTIAAPLDPPDHIGPPKDRTLLPLPPGTYYVFRHLWLPDPTSDYDVSAAIERIAIGQAPGIAHGTIEVVQDEVREYRIDVEPDIGTITTQRTK